LREILEAEVATHLDTINAWLNTAAGQSHSVNEPLLRAVHTLNGAFAMTEFPEITQVMQSAEAYIKRLLTKNQQASVEGVAVLSATATAIADTVATLRTESPRIPSFASLVECLCELVATMPEVQCQLQHLESVSEQTQDVLLSSDVLTGVYNSSVDLDMFDASSDEIEPMRPMIDTPSQEAVYQYDDV
ncbi:MAG TPA: Hpt domain-containing protein, partial [Xylella taiwanensis]